MSKNKRTYTEEFKKEAISLAFRAPSVKGVAEGLGIPEGTLNTWIRATNSSSQNKNQPEVIDLSEELKKLKKENARLREEKEILKKAACFFVRESK